MILILHNFTLWVSSVAQLCPTLCNTMNCSMPGFSVHHQLPEHVHRLADAIQTSHPLSPLLPLLSILPGIRVFSNKSVLIPISQSKVMSLLFNMLSRFVITFLPRSKRLLISWLQSPSAVILEPKKIKSVMVSIVSPSICQRSNCQHLLDHRKSKRIPEKHLLLPHWLC